MTYNAIIEIPRGSDRRIHMSYDGSGFIDLGPIREQIPVNDGVMPVHYGYIENAINKVEKDNVDILIFSSKSYQTGDKIEVNIIGMLNREDGDHKVLAVDNSVNVQSFGDIPEDEKDLLLQYFGYKSKIVSIEDKENASEYISGCLV